MEEHAASVKTYTLVLVLLLVLTGVTTGVAYLDLGAFNPVVAVLIALVKMAFVVLFFMHVKYSSRLVWVFVGLGFIWLALLMLGVFHDYATRGWVPGG